MENAWSACWYRPDACPVSAGRAGAGAGVSLGRAELGASLMPICGLPGVGLAPAVTGGRVGALGGGSSAQETIAVGRSRNAKAASKVRP